MTSKEHLRKLDFRYSDDNKVVVDPAYADPDPEGKEHFNGSFDVPMAARAPTDAAVTANAKIENHIVKASKIVKIVSKRFTVQVRRAKPPPPDPWVERLLDIKKKEYIEVKVSLPPGVKFDNHSNTMVMLECSQLFEKVKVIPRLTPTKKIIFGTEKDKEGQEINYCIATFEVGWATCMKAIRNWKEGHVYNWKRGYLDIHVEAKISGIPVVEKFKDRIFVMPELGTLRGVVICTNNALTEKELKGIKVMAVTSADKETGKVVEHEVDGKILYGHTGVGRRGPFFTFEIEDVDLETPIYVKAWLTLGGKDFKGKHTNPGGDDGEGKRDKIILKGERTWKPWKLFKKSYERDGIVVPLNTNRIPTFFTIKGKVVKVLDDGTIEDLRNKADITNIGLRTEIGAVVNPITRPETNNDGTFVIKCSPFTAPLITHALVAQGPDNPVPLRGKHTDRHGNPRTPIAVTSITRVEEGVIVPVRAKGKKPGKPAAPPVTLNIEAPIGDLGPVQEITFTASSPNPIANPRFEWKVWKEGSNLQDPADVILTFSTSRDVRVVLLNQIQGMMTPENYANEFFGKKLTVTVSAFDANNTHLASATPKNFTIERGAAAEGTTVNGVVQNAETREPIEGAVISATYLDPRGNEARTTEAIHSAANGRFTIESIPQNSTRVLVTAQYQNVQANQREPVFDLTTQREQSVIILIALPTGEVPPKPPEKPTPPGRMIKIIYVGAHRIRGHEGEAIPIDMPSSRMIVRCAVNFVPVEGDPNPVLMLNDRLVSTGTFNKGVVDYQIPAREINAFSLGKYELQAKLGDATDTVIVVLHAPGALHDLDEVEFTRYEHARDALKNKDEFLPLAEALVRSCFDGKRWHPENLSQVKRYPLSKVKASLDCLNAKQKSLHKSIKMITESPVGSDYKEFAKQLKIANDIYDDYIKDGKIVTDCAGIFAEFAKQIHDPDGRVWRLIFGKAAKEEKTAIAVATFLHDNDIMGKDNTHGTFVRELTPNWFARDKARILWNFGQNYFKVMFHMRTVLKFIHRKGPQNSLFNLFNALVIAHDKIEAVEHYMPTGWEEKGVTAETVRKEAETTKERLKPETLKQVQHRLRRKLEKLQDNYNASLIRDPKSGKDTNRDGTLENEIKGFEYQIDHLTNNDIERAWSRFDILMEKVMQRKNQSS